METEAAGKDEYCRIMHFLGDSDDEEEESLTTVMDKVNQTHTLVPSQPISTQIKTNFKNDGKGKADISRLLNNELSKRLNRNAVFNANNNTSSSNEAVRPQVKDHEANFRNATSDPLNDELRKKLNKRLTAKPTVAPEEKDSEKNVGNPTDDYLSDELRKKLNKRLTAKTPVELENQNGEKNVGNSTDDLLSDELRKKLNKRLNSKPSSDDPSKVSVMKGQSTDVENPETNIRSTPDDHFDMKALRGERAAPTKPTRTLPTNKASQPRNKTRKANSKQEDLKIQFIEASKRLAASMTTVEEINLTERTILQDIQEQVPSTKPRSGKTSERLNTVADNNQTQNENQQGHEGDSVLQNQRRSMDNQSTLDLNDEKKAAAVERSLNAAHYLLQNWGFKNRQSIHRIKFDLQKLQYSKRFIILVQIAFRKCSLKKYLSLKKCIVLYSTCEFFALNFRI